MVFFKKVIFLLEAFNKTIGGSEYEHVYYNLAQKLKPMIKSKWEKQHALQIFTIKQRQAFWKHSLPFLVVDGVGEEETETYFGQQAIDYFKMLSEKQKPSPTIVDTWSNQPGGGLCTNFSWLLDQKSKIRQHSFWDDRNKRVLMPYDNIYSLIVGQNLGKPIDISSSTLPLTLKKVFTKEIKKIYQELVEIADREQQQPRARL